LAEEGPSAEELVAQLRALSIGHFLLSNASMLASLTYDKIDTGDLEQARVGIDALQALLPVLEGQIDPEAKRELEAVIANLQVAFAARATAT
jgi:uncharacterized protein DUF1844